MKKSRKILAQAVALALVLGAGGISVGMAKDLDVTDEQSVSGEEKYSAIRISDGGELDVNGGSLTAQTVTITGNGTLPTIGEEDSYSASMDISGGETKANFTNVTLTNGADLDVGKGAKVTITGTLSLNHSLADIYNAAPDDKPGIGAWPTIQIGTLKATNGTQIYFIGQNNSGTNALKFTDISLDNATMTMRKDEKAVNDASTVNDEDDEDDEETSTTAGAKVALFALRRAPAPQNNSSGLEGETDTLSISNSGKLNLVNGAKLNVKGSKGTTTLSGGSIDVQGGSTLSTENLTQNGGTINLGAGADDGNNSIKVSKDISGALNVSTSNTGNTIDASGATSTGVTGVKVSTRGSALNADALAADPNKAIAAAQSVKLKDSTVNTSVSAAEGVVNGTADYVIDSKGNVLSRVVTENATDRQITDLASLSLITWRQENNDLNKRLGEVRDSKGDDGIWARMSRGETSFHGTRYQFNYYQLGYDKKIGDNWILGGAFSYTDGDTSFHDGSGETKHRGFAVYGSNLRNDGSYIDLIAKYARLKNEYDTPLGVGSGDYSTDNDARVHQDSMDSFVGRLGFAVGKDVNRGNVYLRASYLYDFDGDIKASMSNSFASRDYREDIGGGWWEYGVGTNLNLGHDTHFYFDVERAQGGPVKTNWQWNAGVRYAF